ncbi:hypothetical protein [Spirosoma montaniterrae]|uniref:Uncharacterized protein n=1 Tax=Spirosoma montaniterrae TaxID=1178516 RepID=A0A1P9WV71_9BACT|nr:hypothetical protein [Spirosoma montaniterrae]AQG79285.1 hypothetical protein AWR27_08070 [Spirosoma montaniterrae]
MKKLFLYLLLTLPVVLDACKTEEYVWENWAYTAVPLVAVNTSKSALPTVATANTSFFDLSAANMADQVFEYTLRWEGFGKAEVQSINVFLGFVKAPATGNPAYPIVLSQPGGVYPSVTQYPLPSRVGTTDKLYATVTEFPKTFTVTAAQLAAFTGTNLATVAQNDYFVFKFTLLLKDGRQIAGFQENVCDEARGEVGDCRVGVRFRRR